MEGVGWFFQASKTMYGGQGSGRHGPTMVQASCLVQESCIQHQREQRLWRNSGIQMTSWHVCALFRRQWAPLTVPENGELGDKAAVLATWVWLGGLERCEMIWGMHSGHGHLIDTGVQMLLGIPGSPTGAPRFKSWLPCQLQLPAYVHLRRQ